MGIRHGSALVDLPALLTQWRRKRLLSKRKTKGLSFSWAQKGRTCADSRDQGWLALVTEAPSGVGQPLAIAY